jgi:phospholipid transport system substrate-binding protein
MNGLSRRAFLSGLVLLASSGLSAASVVDDAPMVLIKTTSDEVLAAIKDNSEKIKTDPKLVSGLVEKMVLPHIDFQTMSKLVLAVNWRKASAAQQAAFTQEFRELLVRTYSKSLGEYDGQKVTYFPMRAETDPKEALVRTEIQAKSGMPIPVAYRLRKNEQGAWKIIDVVIDEVSLVTNYRNTFAQDVQRVGIDGLIKQLRQSNADGGV